MPLQEKVGGQGGSSPPRRSLKKTKSNRIIAKKRTASPTVCLHNRICLRSLPALADQEPLRAAALASLVEFIGL